MNYESEIKLIKERHNSGVIEKAKSEERLKAFETKKEDILAKCTAKGVKPEELPTKIQESENKLKDLITRANQLFGVDTPIQEESPF